MVIVTFVMMLHIVANAVLRTWWRAPIDYTLEVVQYWYLPIVAFLGFVAAQLRGQHIAADLIYEALPSVTKRYVLAVVFGLCALASAGFAWFGWEQALHAYDIKQTAGISPVPSWPVYFLVPLAFGSLTVQFLAAAVRAIAKPDSHDFVTDPSEAVLRGEVESKEGGVA